jgi:hypothetical protein
MTNKHRGPESKQRSGDGIRKAISIEITTNNFILFSFLISLSGFSSEGGF